MPDPLTDAQLQDCIGLADRLAAARLVILKDRSPVHVPTAFEAVALAGWPEDAIRALLAEVARLRGELAEAERIRDAYRRAKSENDERFMVERDEAREEVGRLRAEVGRLMVDEKERQRWAPP